MVTAAQTLGTATGGTGTVITRLQVIDLRDKGVITKERAADWLSILEKGGVLNVSQKIADQAGSTASLLPDGVTLSGDNEIEINFRDISRDGIFELRTAGLINKEQTFEFLERRDQTISRPESIGGRLLDTFRAAFDPTDPRGTIDIGPVPVKTGLVAAGAGIAAPAAATAGAGTFPTVAAAGGSAGVRAAGGALTGAAGRLAAGARRVVGRRPTNVGTAALLGTGIAGAGLAAGGAISEDTPPDITQLGPESIPVSQGGTALEALETSSSIDPIKALVDAILDSGGTPKDAEEEVRTATGQTIRIETVKVRRFNPLTGKIEDFDQHVTFITERIPDPNNIGQFITVERDVSSVIPRLNQAQFELEQSQVTEQRQRETTTEATERSRQQNIRSGQARVAQEREERRQFEATRTFEEGQRQFASQQQSQLLQLLPQLLSNPRSFNLLRLLGGKALNLPGQLGALFGLEPGQGFSLGDSGQPGAITGGQGAPLGPGGPAEAELTGTPRSITGEASGFSGDVPTLLGQITPGTFRQFSPEQRGVGEAVLIASGTTLEEEQRKARQSQLPGGSLRGR
ncbi:hypothetical protein LCGC14_0364080 [marine sediment metagenome]|uniref:Uncharacterized protein n=1 Tax=marine sediment metagenome TaxID=412755 RepID=A0A0F9TCW6_9ZZZZ